MLDVTCCSFRLACAGERETNGSKVLNYACKAPFLLPPSSTTFSLSTPVSRRNIPLSSQTPAGYCCPPAAASPAACAAPQRRTTSGLAFLTPLPGYTPPSASRKAHSREVNASHEIIQEKRTGWPQMLESTQVQSQTCAVTKALTSWPSGRNSFQVSPASRHSVPTFLGPWKTFKPTQKLSFSPRI